MSQYNQLTKALSQVDTDTDAAECHGMLCGMLSAHEKFDPTQWLSFVAGRDELAPFGPEGSGHLVWDMLKDTKGALASGEFDLRLVLPSEEESSAIRARALVNWCRGYLSAFGTGGAKGFQKLDEDGKEFVADLTKIAQMNTEIETTEENDSMLMELAEFLKVGVLLVYETLITKTTPPGSVPSSANVH